MEKDAILQSESAYIAQFDPTSPDFHGGSSTPVPLGGARVPVSMPQQHPENFNITAVEPTPEELGPEYLKVEQERNSLTNLKKALDKLSPFVEAIFRHNENYRTKADKTNDKHLELHKADVLREEKEIENIEASVLEIVNHLADTNNDFKQIQNEVVTLLKQARDHFETKEDLTEFGFKTKRLTAKLFAETKKQLEVLKKIKKNYKLNQKVEQVPVQEQTKEVEKPKEQAEQPQ